MKFVFKKFECDVDIFRNEDDILVRFYDKSLEQEEKDIINYVIVDSGFGSICLKFKGEDALLSGVLYKNVFQSVDIISAAIDFVEKLSPKSEFAYIPHHINLVSNESYVEYNGETDVDGIIDFK